VKELLFEGSVRADFADGADEADFFNL